jgi:tetratricopeptide (TPR) repeat protein
MGLDHDKPIVLDPHVVRGQQRAFPAQIDPATFQNANYNKGYEALMRTTFSVKDAMDAVAYFKAAQLQRPNDPMVHNGLLLAEDILKGRQQKEQEDKDRAMQSLYHGLAALIMGDPATAADSARRASKLDPNNPVVANWNLTLTTMSAIFKAPGQGNKNVEMLVGNALLSETYGDYTTEVREMKEAKSLAPESTYVDEILDHARHLSQEFPARSAVQPQAHTPKTPARDATVHN